MEVPTPDELIMNAHNIINSNESIIRFILNQYYYILSNLFLMLQFVIYCKEFTSNETYIYFKNDYRKIKYMQKLTLLEKGIYFCDYFAPYESIIKVGLNKEFIILTLFGKVNFIDKVEFMDKRFVKIQLDKSKYTLLLKIDNPQYVFDTIKSNMHYHIKYNKVDKNIVEYYIDKKFV